jgi:hypothetical protein
VVVAVVGRELRDKLPRAVVQVLERHGAYIIGAETLLLVNLFAWPPLATPAMRLAALFVSALVMIGTRLIADQRERAGVATAMRAAPSLTTAVVNHVLDAPLLKGGTDVPLAWDGNATIRSLAAMSEDPFSTDWDTMLGTLAPRGRDLCREVEALEVSFRASAGHYEDFDFARHISLFGEALRDLAGAALTLWAAHDLPRRPGGGPLVVSSQGAVYSAADAQALLAKHLSHAERVGDALVRRADRLRREQT